MSILTEEHLKIVEEIKSAITNGPTFNQSGFQNIKFNIETHRMPARTYRQILLELNNKFLSLQKAEICAKKMKAQVNILRKELEVLKDEDQRTIKKCEIDDKLIDLEQQEKLALDCINECNSLYALFKTLPKITSEDFEKEDEQYWHNRIMYDAEVEVLTTGRVATGTARSLVQLGYDPLRVQSELITIQHNRHIEIENKTASKLIVKETKNNLLESGKGK